LAGVVGQSFKERGEVRARGHFDVADGQTAQLVFVPGKS
jgi:hypothetical protein